MGKHMFMTVGKHSSLSRVTSIGQLCVLALLQTWENCGGIMKAKLEREWPTTVFRSPLRKSALEITGACLHRHESLQQRSFTE